MGQAKNRGTFEERKAAAIERDGTHAKPYNRLASHLISEVQRRQLQAEGLADTLHRAVEEVYDSTRLDPVPEVKPVDRRRVAVVGGSSGRRSLALAALLAIGVGAMQGK